MFSFCTSGLCLTINGAARVKWTEGGARSSVTYQGEQVFMNSVNFFFGKKGGEAIEVSSGVHLYKFACRIPKNAPASAEGKFGYIRYKVDVNLDIPYMPDMSSKQSFVIVRHEDLNQYPELRIPTEVEEVKTFCCFICESDPLLLKISSLRSGYCLGEKANVKVEVFNRSNVSFKKSLISLNRVETFLSYTPMQKTKKNITTMTAVMSKGAAARKNSSFDEVIHIPTNSAVSNDRISDVFQISYEIKVFMKAAKKSTSVEASVPIFIGTDAFRLNSNVSLDSSSLPIDDLREFSLFFHYNSGFCNNFSSL